MRGISSFSMLVYALVGALCSCVAMAQSLEQQQSVPLGEAALYPSIRIDYLSNDNIGLLSENEVDGSATVVSPELVLVAEKRGLAFRADYTGEYSVGSVSALDTTDHILDSQLSADFDSRRRARLVASFARLHQDLGDGLTSGRGGEFDQSLELNRYFLEGAFDYGARNARGNLIIGLRLGATDFVNLGEVADGRSFSLLQPFGRFGYRLSGDTRATLELRGSSFSFDDSDRDRDVIALLLGMSFAASGQLTGSFGVGIEAVDPIASELDGTTLFAIESDVTFRPNSFAVLSLGITREVNNDGIGVIGTGGDLPVETNVRLGWEHSWSSWLSSSAFVAGRFEDETCPTTVSTGIEVNFNVRRWLQVGGSFDAASRDVDACASELDAGDLEYERQLIGAHIRATL
jgi:hypothetical protein